MTGMMDYEQARQFTAEAAKSGSCLGLGNIRHLMRVLGNVQDQIPIIHIAGTNGKGSVGAFLDCIFREAGFHVGRYCSPAVFSPLEVWQYDGMDMGETEYAAVMSQVKDACDIVVLEGGDMPTVFEIETAAAFIYFCSKKPDVLLLEAGMGGETDATNVVTRPLCSVFTSISLDHMKFLGKTTKQIAKIKSGIVKNGAPVFSAPQKPAVWEVLSKRARECGCRIEMVEQEKIRLLHQDLGRLEFFYGDTRLETKMAGNFQMANASLAMIVAKFAMPKLEHKTSSSGYANMGTIVQGIARAVWKGRFEVLGMRPPFVIDGAHNEGAACQLAKTVEMCFTNTQLTYIIGVLEDKEHEKMLQAMMPYAKRVYTVTPDNPRALDGRILCREAAKFHCDATYCGSVGEAVQKALADKDPVLAFGSLSYMGQLRRCYEAQYK